MTRIVHISDLHFGRERPRLVAALVEQVRALRPDLVVASGDLTQRARRHELVEAAAFVERLPRPVLVVPGNHDIPGVTPTRFVDPWRRWLRHFPDGLEPLVDTPKILAVGANSARRWGPYIDWSRGRLGRAQIDRLAAQVVRGGGRLRVLAVHHPLLLTAAVAHRGEVGHRDLALARFREAGLDLVLSGHVHHAYCGAVDGIVVAHAGTTVSNRLYGEVNSFNLIRYDDRTLEVQAWGWRGESFASGASSGFRRAAAGWQLEDGSSRSPAMSRLSVGHG